MSYTYFTWKNSPAELREYFEELTQSPMVEYYRGNLFANTPDILNEYLVNGGRPAFRVALAARGDAPAAVRHLQRVRAVRERARPPGQRGVPRLGEVPAPPARLRSSGQHQRRHRTVQRRSPHRSAAALCSSRSTERESGHSFYRKAAREPSCNGGRWWVGSAVAKSSPAHRTAICSLP